MTLLPLLLTLVTPAVAAPTCEIPVAVNLQGMPDGLWTNFSTSLWEALGMWDFAPENVKLHASWEPVEVDSKPGTIIVKFSTLPGGNKKYIGNASSERTRHGSIMSSLIEISSSDPWCQTDTQADCYHIRNTILHEVGHALGLEHNADPRSIMYYGTSVGSPKIQTIPDADKQALMHLFPDDGSGCNYQDGRYAWSKIP